VKKIDSERQQLFDIYQHTIESEFAAGFTIDQLLDARPDLPAHLAAYIAHEGERAIAGGFMRRTAEDGLPVFPAIDDDGTRVTREAMKPHEYDYAVLCARDRGDANYARARRWGAAKLAAYGIPCILDGVNWSEQAS